jgi:hypothetical protein
VVRDPDHDATFGRGGDHLLEGEVAVRHVRVDVEIVAAERGSRGVLAGFSQSPSAGGSG